MDETAKMDGHLSSAAAFVEGGIQDPCDDACSICLEAFCDNDPSTLTSCKHEFHLQCILEWCQRSAQCPICWQHISLKDPTSQELLEAVDRERSIRSNQTRSAAIFHHPALGDFELQHLPVGANDAELEDRIIQHLAAAAAMGRAHHIARRDGRGRSGTQGRPQFVVFSAHPNGSSIGAQSANTSQSGESDQSSIGEETQYQIPHIHPAQADRVAVLPSESTVPTVTRPILSSSRSSAGQSTPVSQDSAGPSDFQSFSESLKSRLNSVSMRYKDSITKSTRGWKDRLFSRSNSVSDIGSEVRREVNAGIATVSRMMERLDTRDRRRTSSTPPGTEGHSIAEPSNERFTENHERITENNARPNNNNTPSSCAAISGEN